VHEERTAKLGAKIHGLDSSSHPRTRCAPWRVFARREPAQAGAPGPLRCVRLFGVGAAGEDGEGAVDLLSEHDAGELVGVGHGAQGDFLFDALAEFVGEAVSIAADENDFAGAAIALFAEPTGEDGGIVDFSGGVEEESGSGTIGVEFFDGGIGVAYFGEFDRTRTGDAFEIVREDSGEFGAARFAEHEEANFHGGSVEHRVASDEWREKAGVEENGRHGSEDPPLQRGFPEAGGRYQRREEHPCYIKRAELRLEIIFVWCRTLVVGVRFVG